MLMECFTKLMINRCVGSLNPFWNLESISAGIYKPHSNLQKRGPKFHHTFDRLHLHPICLTELCSYVLNSCFTRDTLGICLSPLSIKAIYERLQRTYTVCLTRKPRPHDVLNQRKGIPVISRTLYTVHFPADFCGLSTATLFKVQHWVVFDKH